MQQGLAGVGAIIAGIWAGLAWHGSGRVSLVIAGFVAAVAALAVLVFAPRSVTAKRTATV